MRVVYVIVGLYSTPPLASPRLFLLAVDDVGVWRHKDPRQHGLLYSTPRLAGDLALHSSNSMSLGTYVWMFYAFFNHFDSSIFEIALWMAALSSPYIAQERTAQSAILSVRSERFALCLKERHRSQNEGSLKSEERLSDFKERYAQLCF